MKKKRIGILGGSFDPPHLGHALNVKRALESGEFDEVWMMPCPSNPLKSSSPKVSPTDRLKMCEFIAERIPNAKVSDFEIKNNINRTWEALEKLTAENPTSSFMWIVGTDCIKGKDGLEGWMNGKEIIKKYGLVLLPRGGIRGVGSNYFDVDSELKNKIKFLSATGDDNIHMTISSSQIRKLIEKGKSISFLVPEKVEEYIEKNRLYKNDPSEKVDELFNLVNESIEELNRLLEEEIRKAMESDQAYIITKESTITGVKDPINSNFKRLDLTGKGACILGEDIRYKITALEIPLIDNTYLPKVECPNYFKYNELAYISVSDLDLEEKVLLLKVIISSNREN